MDCLIEFFQLIYGSAEIQIRQLSSCPGTAVLWFLANNYHMCCFGAGAKKECFALTLPTCLGRK